MKTNQSREQWLQSLTTELDSLLFNKAMPVYRVTCGWPSKGALANKNRTIGQCFPPVCSADNTTELIITMGLAEPMEVAEVLAHEMVHAIVGCEHGHKRPFKRLATSIGLEGKMTATHGSDAFKQSVLPILDKIGMYPHAKLDSSKTGKKQGTRLIKAECLDCGYNVRITRKWLDDTGLPLCPLHGEMAEA
jgi:hypothetical protein